MIIKFNSFIKENYGPKLSYCAFDIDDNLLHMPTVIHMDRKINGQWVATDVSTSKFAKVRIDKDNWRLVNNDPKKAFSEFGDVGSRGDKAFITDMKNAIVDGKFGPAWETFIKCLCDGSIFALITARGNEPLTYRKAVEYIIDEVLTKDQQFLLYNNCLRYSHIFKQNGKFDKLPKGKISKTLLISKYLSNCSFYGVSSITFSKEFGLSLATSPEMAKEMALDKFIDKCNKFGNILDSEVSVGFSDDDPSNIEHIRKYFKEKSVISNNLKLKLFKTTNRQIKGGEPVNILESNGFDGMQSSVLPYTKWNNMTQNLYQNSKDSPKDPYHNRFKNQVASVLDLTKNTKGIIKKRRKIGKKTKINKTT